MEINSNATDPIIFRCDVGYYGNPLAVGGSCKQCDCHGNAGHCDQDTGECLVCLHHTEGEKCERCMTGYYGTALNGDCSREFFFSWKHSKTMSSFYQWNG